MHEKRSVRLWSESDRDPIVKTRRNAKQALSLRLAVLIAATSTLGACSPEEEVTGSVHNKCATQLYPSYNRKALDQCVAVCIKCDNGSTTTCSTSCTLKGAH